MLLCQLSGHPTDADNLDKTKSEWDVVGEGGGGGGGEEVEGEQNILENIKQYRWTKDMLKHLNTFLQYCNIYQKDVLL